MARSSGMAGQGTTVGIATLAATSATLISEVKNVTKDGEDTTDADLTHLASDDHHKEYAPGDVEPGQVTLRMNYTQAQYNTLLGYKRTVKDIWITYPDGSTVKQTCYIKGVSNEVPEDGGVTCDVTFKLSGAPVSSTE